MANKNKHTLEVFKELGKNITRYLELPESKQRQIDVTIVESLLAHPDTEIYTNVMAQGREPVSLALNRGLGDYAIPNHLATFERHPELFQYNHYISNYIGTEDQVVNVDASANTSITYDDLVGNSQTNIGSVFGKTDPPTSAPTVESSAPTVNDGTIEEL